MNNDLIYYGNPMNWKNVTGDLIGRSALKESIRKRLGISSLKYLTEQEKVIVDEIDKAPLVEYTFEEAFQKTVCEQRLYCPERSQGEWIIKPKENSQSAILICNKCNHFIPITIDNNFCPNCGADMRKEEENATRM